MRSAQAVRSALGVLAVVLVLAFATPCPAQVAVIEATAPLPDRSEGSIMTAIAAAVAAAAEQALALGLPWAAISQARVLEDRVTVEILATDTDPAAEGEMERAPGGTPGPGPNPAAKPPL